MEQSTSTVLSTPAAQAAAPIITASGAGSPLFIINLCASMAPIAGAGKTLPGFDNHRLYQVARVEDGRTRHRLRLGFFTTQDEAEKALALVRAQYPTAFTACLADEDKKFTRGFVADAAPAAPPSKPQIAVVVDNDSTRPQMKALQVDSPPPAEDRAAAPAPLQAPKVAAKAETPVAKPAAPAAAAPAPRPAATAPAAPVANQAKPAATTSKPTTPVEIEITFEPPALKAPAAPIAAAPVAKPAAPAAAAPSAVAKAPAPTKPESLELAAAGSRLSTGATGQHRGIVASKAPALDSIDLSLANDTVAGRVPSKPTASAASNQPFHVGKGVHVPTTNLSLDSEQRASAPPAPASSQPRQQSAAPVAPIAQGPAQTQVKGAAPKAVTPAKSPAAPAPAKADAASAPFNKGDIDSTQTIRALTEAELNDESQEKWFAIQLAVSDQPVNLDTMPHLDIFEAYRVYSVATAGNGKITHSLRIGFFREHVSAEAVSGYLKTFFPTPSIVRISVAEQARFKDPPEKPAAPEPGESNVVALSDARARKPPVIPTVTMAVETPDLNATGSFKPNATGSFKPHATGAFKPNATGSFKPGATGSFKAGATGSHKAIKTAAQTSAKGAAPATKHSPATASMSKKSATGKHPMLPPKKRLSEELIDEAREVELEESGIRQPSKSGSLLSRLVGKLSK